MSDTSSDSYTLEDMSTYTQPNEEEEISSDERNPVDMGSPSIPKTLRLPRTPSEMRESEREAFEGPMKLRRGGDWQAWEDRALVKEITGVNPLDCPKGKSTEKWEEVSQKLKKAGSDRSGKSCKMRFHKLLAEHRKNNLRSLQKTGTNEQISDFLYEMENLNSLAEQQSKDPTIKAEARDKAKKLEEEGKLARQAAMEGMTADTSEKGRNKRKRGIESMIEELEQESNIYEKKIRDMEKEDIQRHEELIEEQRRTTEVIRELCMELSEERKLVQEERKEFMELLRTLLPPR